MGARGKKFRNKRHSGSNGATDNKANTDNRPSGDYQTLVRENSDFEHFYRTQNIVATEHEWNEFMDSLRSPLPISFRITGSRDTANEVKNILKSVYFPALQGLEIDGVIVDPPHILPFYPNELAYQYSVGRSQTRKCPQLSGFHQFLVEETDIGNISRQEAVSMVPPLLLDVQSHHAVLDLCAAPGSKTGQLIEAMHADTKPGEMTNGIVVANDVDTERAYTLIHQVKRLSSPCLMVTNHDASFYPILYTSDANGESVPLQFDRILADVPCSGDGTMRKNPIVWKKWGVNGAHGLHVVQSNILKRALQMVKVGGRVVYSTCSLNPIENEAVISHVLSEYKASIKVLDMSNQLPGLVRRPGLQTWKVVSKSGKTFTRFNDVPLDNTSVKPSMFPVEGDDEIKCQLVNCIRILPHLQNSGAFFVAVIEKTGPITKMELKQDKEEKDSKEEETIQVEGNQAADIEVQNSTNEKKPERKGVKRKEMFQSRIEEPFIMIRPEAQEIVDFKQHYGLSPKFPLDQFLVRSEEGKHRTLYFVSKRIKDLISCPSNANLKIVNTGVKSFGRNTITSYINSDGVEEKPGEYCSLRIHHEFLPAVFPFVSGSRVIDFTKEDLLKVLTAEFPMVHEFSKEVSKKLQELTYGGFIVRYEGEPSSHLNRVLYISIWRARTSINALVNAKERISLVKRLTNAFSIVLDKKASDEVPNEVSNEVLDEVEEELEKVK